MGKTKKLRKQCQLLELKLQKLELEQRIGEIKQKPIAILGFHKNATEKR